MNSAVDRLYEEASSIIERLDVSDISLRSSADEYFKKSLLIAAASYFESRLLEIIRVYVGRNSSHVYLQNFINKAVIERKFHTLFNWKVNNANQFLGLFGDEFKELVKNMAKNYNVDKAEIAFMEIGRERNELIHGDYATFPLEKNLKEVHEKYKEALPFLDIIEKVLNSAKEKI